MLPARDLERLAVTIPVETELDLAMDYVEMIPKMSLNLCDVMLPKLLVGVARQETQQAIRFEFSEGDVSLALLLWLTRHYTDESMKDVVSPTMLSTMCLAAIDISEMGERLTLRHYIERQFNDETWLAQLAAQLPPDALRTMFDRIRDTDGNWEPPTKRAIIARLTKLYPELATVSEEVLPVAQEHFTSWRSYNARLEQRRKLVEEDLPANASDIARRAAMAT